LAGSHLQARIFLKVWEFLCIKTSTSRFGEEDVLILKLAELGLYRVTCEGGPRLLAQLLSARVVNEYDLTISPITVGGSPLWPEARPSVSQWDEVGSAFSGDYEFKRLLLHR
jgi:riboflavin biosynthesis pyrimidine reductase